MWPRLLEAIHGHLGVLAAAALFHPAILMRRGKVLSRGARYSIVFSTLFSIAAFAVGLAIYENYRATVKFQLFRLNLQAGYLFETKEHLAYAVISLSIGAAICALVSPNKAQHLRQAAAAAYLTAALLATSVVVLGTYVTSVHTFPE